MTSRNNGASQLLSYRKTMVNNGNNMKLKCLMECLIKTEECLIEAVDLSDTKFEILLLMYTGNMRFCQ